MTAEPFTTYPRLKFRAVPDSLARFHVEGSECCLIHTDNPLSETMGVFINPKVRVGYNLPAYMAVHPIHKWLSTWQILWSLWESRIRLLFTSPMFKEWVIHKRISTWLKLVEENSEIGEICIINEMQLLTTNGWKHDQ